MMHGSLIETRALTLGAAGRTLVRELSWQARASANAGA